MGEEQEASQYDISQQTSNGDWTFADGFKIDQTGSPATGSDGTIKYSRNKQYTITIPDGISISKVTIYGYCNADGATGYLGELAGKKLLDNGSASVGVVVKMPLDLFGGATNKVRSAKAAYQIAQLEQQDIDERLQLEWAQCRNLYDEAQTELHLCQVALEQAAENMRLSKQQYEVGFETLADYLETQSHWQQCNASLVNARCQLQLAYVRLLKASGKLK